MDRTFQGVESRPNFDGTNCTYLGVGGQRKELKLDFLPEAESYGDIHYLWLSVDPGVLIYSSPTEGTPLATRYWDDYAVCNWEDVPSSVWVAATQSGQKYVSLEYHVEQWIWILCAYWSATHQASVMLNCIKADIQGGVSEGQEENPGDYLGGQKAIGLSVSGPELNGQGTVTLTWDTDKVTVKANNTLIESPKTWAYTALPPHVDVSSRTEDTASTNPRDQQFHLTYSGHDTTSVDNLNMTVVGIVWMPLGEATSLTRYRVGRVYVPTKYGGVLKLDGSGSKLYPVGDLMWHYADWAKAIQIAKGELTPTESGDPCTRDVPRDEFRWYYVSVDHDASLAASFKQCNVLPEPWACPWYPYAEALGGNLYVAGGPLAKYDEAFSVGGSSALDHEKRNWCYLNGHYLKGVKVEPEYLVKLFENDAERSIGYDIDDADQDHDVWTGWDEGYNLDFWHEANNAWGQDGLFVSSPSIGWYGHCTEAAAVCLCEPRPRDSYTATPPSANGLVVFDEPDRIGLLVALYHGPNSSRETGPDPLPEKWHNILEECIMSASAHPFVCDTTNTTSGRDIIWNHPIYGIEETRVHTEAGLWRGAAQPMPVRARVLQGEGPRPSGPGIQLLCPVQLRRVGRRFSW